MLIFFTTPIFTPFYFPLHFLSAISYTIELTVLIALVAVTVYSIDSYYAYKIFQQESLYFEDTEITDY